MRMAHFQSAALRAALALLALVAVPRLALADPSYDCTGVGVLTDSTSNAVVNANGQVDCISTPGATVSLYGTVEAAASLGDPTTASNFQYDAQDRLLSDTGAYNSSNDSTSNTYDGQDRMMESNNSIAGTTQYFYDPGDDLIETIDPSGNTYQYTYQYYDGMNRVTQETVDTNGTTTQYQYSYNPVTNELETITQYDADNNIIGMSKYTYYGDGDLDTVTDPAGNTVQFFYDPGTDVLSYTEYDSNTGIETKYYYDTTGQLNQSIDPLGNITNYNYDTIGNLLSATDPSGLTTFIYSTVPEPGTLALIAPALAGWFGIGGLRRRRRTA
jgi:YD repeat-containing protein